MSAVDEQTADLIDRAYDGADSFVRGVGRMLGVDVDQPQPGEVAATQTIPVAAPVLVAPPRPSLPAPRVLALPGPVGSPAWFIVPLRNERGEAVYAVTDGRSGVCASTRQAAEIVLATLTAAQAAQAAEVAA